MEEDDGGWADIAPELWAMVMSYLSPLDVSLCKEVCNSWLGLCDDEVWWRKRVCEWYGNQEKKESESWQEHFKYQTCWGWEDNIDFILSERRKRAYCIGNSQNATFVVIKTDKVIPIENNLRKYSLEIEFVCGWNSFAVGVADYSISNSRHFSFLTNGVAYYAVGKIWSGESIRSVGSSEVERYGVGDKIGMVIDMEDRTILFLKNGKPVCEPRNLKWVTMPLHIVVFCPTGSEFLLTSYNDARRMMKGW